MRDTSRRREKILSLLRKHRSVQVEDLSRSFRVSSQTIRQDLNFLENLGTAVRSYGGAVLRDDQLVAVEAPIEAKRVRFSKEKTAIGKAAAALIQSGDSVILDSGTTTLQVAAQIPKNLSSLTVITNDLAIANELAGRDHMQIVMLGGTLRQKNMSLFGTQAEHAVQHMSVDKLFLGVDGFDLQKGITTHFEAEATLNRMMCSAAAEIIAVTDSSKFGKTCLHKIIEPAKLSKLITDNDIPRELMEQLTRLGVQVIRTSDSG